MFSNSNYAYDPDKVNNFTREERIRRAKRNDLLSMGQRPVEVSEATVPIAAGLQDADFYLPMNGGLHPDNAAPGVSATTNLNAFLEGDRTSAIVNNKQGQAVARQARPGQKIRVFDDYGQTALARVTAPSQRIDQEIFQGSIPQQQAVPDGAAQYLNENFIKQRVAADDSNWDVIHPDDAPSVYGYQGEKGFVDINEPSPFPRLTSAPITSAREALINLGLSEGQNEEGIKRTLFGGQGNTGIGGSGSVLSYEVIPGTTLNVDQLPPVQQQRIGELQNKQDYLTDGEGFVAYKDLEWRQHPVFNGGVEMLPGAEKYDPVIAGWLEGNQVNEQTKTTEADKRKRQGLKSRWEPVDVAMGNAPLNPKGFFDYTSDHPKMQALAALNEAGNLSWQYANRPITESIQNLKPNFNQQAFEQALAMGDDLSRFYKPAVTEQMLDAGLPSESQMLTADQVIGQIDRESKNQLAQKNLESIDLYQKPSDIRPPGSGYENYNLQNKYANISDQMALNDAYDQQWDKNPPDIYTHYSGGPVRYNDAGVAIGFGDKNLQPNVELAEGIKNLLPVSDVYTSTPQVVRDKRTGEVIYNGAPDFPVQQDSLNQQPVKRNIVPLHPEVADLPAMQKAQELIREHLADITNPVQGLGLMGGITRPGTDTARDARTGRRVYAGEAPMKTTGMTLGDMPEISGAIPGAFLQHVDDVGNLLLGADKKPLVTPYTPSSDLNQRSDELSRVVLSSGNSYVPYVGVVGEPLMNENPSQNQAGDWVQKVSDTELVRDIDTMPDAVQKMAQLKDSARNHLAQALVNSTSPEFQTAPTGFSIAELNSPPTIRSAGKDLYSAATPYMGQVAMAGNYLADAVNENYAGARAATQQADNIQSVYDKLTAVDPAMNVDTEKFNVGVAVAPGQSTDAIANLLQEHGVDPVVNDQLVMGQGELPVGDRVKLAQGIRRTLAPEVPDAAIGNDPELAHLRDQWKEERASGIVKSSDPRPQELRTLWDGQRAFNSIPDPTLTDPSLAQFYQELDAERTQAASYAADSFAQIKNQLRQKRLDEVGRPILKNKSEEDMRRNLNFMPDDDWGMLSEDVHPMDRVAPRYTPEYIPSPWNGTAPGSTRGVSVVDLSSVQPQQTVRALPPSNIPVMQGEFVNTELGRSVDVPPSNFQAQMAAATPFDYAQGTPDFDWNPSAAEAAYYGQGRRSPGGGMVHTPTGVDFNPSGAEPQYYGQGRPTPGGEIMHTSMPAAAAANPWYKGKAGLMLGGAAALGLGALAYANAKRQQDEEDLRSQQLAQMTGWR